jgi:glycosyltransferase involved in cell wall biosynthesis
MDSDHPAPQPEVSIIVPARNEEVCLSDCLNSLVGQTRVTFEIIVVDDDSTDRTRQIATSFAGVHVVSAPPLPIGWTGKNNAIWAGVQEARGEWLLFTDADTVHVPGSLARALAEAKEQGTDMLSYSPEQIAVTLWEMAVLPVVFAELAHQYPPKKVSDPASPIAAANGQYILIRRQAYDAVGGHRAIAGDLLEDVALARAVKSSGHKLQFRYGGDAVRTRMYRNFQQLREGWTKNLALLFPNPTNRATALLAWWIIAWLTLPLPIAALALYARIRRCNFGVGSTVTGTIVGVPFLTYLLFRSKIAHQKGQVNWKGRAIQVSSDPEASTSTLAEAGKTVSAG